MQIKNVLRGALICGALLAPLARALCPPTVSQAPYITDTIRWLGAEHCIIGVSEFEKISTLPRTGGLMNPDIAAIKKLQPRLIIFADWRKPADAPTVPSVWQAPAIAGIAKQRVFGFQSVDQIIDNIIVIGKRLQVDDARRRAQDFKQMLAQQFAALRTRTHSRKIALVTGCGPGSVLFGAESYIFDVFLRAGYSVQGPSAATQMLSKDPTVELATYVQQQGVEKIVVLDNLVDGYCMDVLKKTNIPFQPLGDTAFRSPSPLLLRDLELLGFD